MRDKIVGTETLPDVTLATASSDTVVALSTLALYQAMNVNFEQVLTDFVFSRPVEHADKKAVLAYQRVLKGPDAPKILFFIWKESSHVTSDDLTAAGMSKANVMDSITCYGLATKLAESPTEVSALNTCIRSITIAAAAYGLVERQQITPKKVYVKGTPLLHQIMVRLGRENEHAFERFLRPPAALAPKAQS